MNEKLKERIKLLWILLLIIIIILLLFYGASAVAKKNRSFYVKYVNRGHAADTAISIAEDVGFTTASTVLRCPTPEELTCISGTMDIPDDIAGKEGCCNGANYIAYGFYIRNTSDRAELVNEKVLIDSVSKNVDAALRVKIYRNYEAVVYAKLASDGMPEYGTVPFKDSKTVSEASHTLTPGEVDKYMVVLWIEGDDLECVNEIGGGSVSLHMEFEVEKTE